MDLKSIITSCYHLETLRIELYEELNNQSDKYVIPYDLPIVNNAVAEWNGTSIKFTIPEILHSKKVLKEQLERKIANYWIGSICSAYRKLPAPVSIERAYCWIVMYAPFNHPWDVDNRCYKFIVDGIRLASIIKDDSTNYLSLGIAGMMEKVNPRTEIYITEMKDIKRYILSNFGNF